MKTKTVRADQRPAIDEHAYGFKWGAAEVTRLLSHKGGVLLSVASPRGSVELWVTRTGKIKVERARGFVDINQNGNGL